MKRLVGERRALVAAVLAFYAFFYGVLALLGAAGALGPAIAALAGVYGLAFFGLVAGYFWARWFASGVTMFGTIQGALALWQIGPEPIALFLLVTHGLAALFLWGDAMGAVFDGQTAWRERMSMDEHAAHRLGNAITRLGVSLPLVVLWALAPRAGSHALALAACGLATLSAVGIFRMRTWAVFAMLGTVGLLAGSVATSAGGVQVASGVTSGAPLAALAAGLLLAAAVPFFAPIRDFLRAR